VGVWKLEAGAATATEATPLHFTSLRHRENPQADAVD